MKEQGWIKLHRGIMDHSLWKERPFDKARAWLDLLMLAEYEDGEIYARNRLITKKRGEVHYSQEYLSERWGWDKRKTKRFLNGLEMAGMVVVKRLENGTLITVVNYNRFQGDGTPDGTRNGTPDGTADGTHLKNIKNIKKEEDIPPVVPRGEDGRFDRFWEAYPKKVGKGEARKAFARLKVSGELLDRMLAALTRQRVSDQWNRENGRFIPNPATWLNQERWSDELKGPVVRVRPVNPAANFSQRVWEDDPDDMERFMKGPVILK